MRKTEKPCAKGCAHSGGWFRRHSWSWSSFWNGNNRKVLPFLNTTRGLARSGWRCWWCGEFRWDQTDTEYALSVAHAWGLIKIPLGEDQ
jgi:hypothetical protein